MFRVLQLCAYSFVYINSFVYFSVVFWIGDLNYRIDMEINQVKDYVTSGALHKLMPKDQVRSGVHMNVVYRLKCIE